MVALAAISIGLWALVLITSPDRFFMSLAYLNVGLLGLLSALTRLALTLV